jgi:hypothetical protein
MPVKENQWNRVLWGVLFTDKSECFLLGVSWYGPVRPQYPGEPTRALLFTTRSAAQAWCREQQTKYASCRDELRQWRFHPVRVIEEVRHAKVPAKARKPVSKGRGARG